MVSKITVRPRNLCLDSAYAAIEANTRWPPVPTNEISTVLKMYRLTGTHELDIRLNRSEKFFSVGLRTKKRGGNIHNSSSGFSDCEMA